MKVFFIYPNSGSQVGFNYGLSHISSVLTKAELDEIFDYQHHVRNVDVILERLGI